MIVQLHRPDDVKSVQEALKTLNCYPGIVDGIAGPIFKSGVKKFQSENDLKVDGIMGPKTFAVLQVKYANRPANSPMPPAPPASTSSPTQPAPAKRPPGLLRVPLGPVVQKGFDISSYNKVRDWSLPKAAGFKYAGFKAAEGLDWDDPTFLGDWAAAKAAGLKRIAYFFFHPKDDPAAQAANFLKMTKGVWEKGDRVMLDWEVTDNVLAPADVAAARVFIKLVQVEDVDCIIYFGPYFAEALDLDESFAIHPIMVAEYGPSVPLIPYPFLKCTFWQTSDKGNVPGIGPVDISVFNGTEDEMDEFFS